MLYISAEFSISLCTENGVPVATETAICNFSNSFWSSSSALKAGKWEVLGSILAALVDLAIQNFLWFFSETRINMD